MEDKRKRKIDRLELWEVAHTKRNGRFSTDKVEAVMEAASVEIQKRKDKNNGLITAHDANDVFNEIVAKDLKARGYYDDKYWSGSGYSQGVKFATQLEQEIRTNEKLETMENMMFRMGTVMKRWLDFMSKRFPEEGFIQEMKESLLDEEEGHMASNSNGEKVVYNSSRKADAPSNEVQGGAVKVLNGGPAIQRVKQQAQPRKDELINNGTPETDKSLESEEATMKKARTRCSSLQDDGIGSSNLSSDPTTANMMTRRVQAPDVKSSQAPPMDVYLMSLRNKWRIAATGKLVVVYGKEYGAVLVEGIENVDNGNEEELLPTPILELRTVKDAVGHVITWPRSHLRKPKSHPVSDLQCKK